MSFAASVLVAADVTTSAARIHPFLNNRLQAKEAYEP